MDPWCDHANYCLEATVCCGERVGPQIGSQLCEDHDPYRNASTQVRLCSCGLEGSTPQMQLEPPVQNGGTIPVLGPTSFRGVSLRCGKLRVWRSSNVNFYSSIASQNSTASLCGVKGSLPFLYRVLRRCHLESVTAEVQILSRFE